MRFDLARLFCDDRRSKSRTPWLSSMVYGLPNRILLNMLCYCKRIGLGRHLQAHIQPELLLLSVQLPVLKDLFYSCNKIPSVRPRYSLTYVQFYFFIQVCFGLIVEPHLGCPDVQFLLFPIYLHRFTLLRRISLPPFIV